MFHLQRGEDHEQLETFCSSLKLRKKALYSIHLGTHFLFIIIIFFKWSPNTFNSHIIKEEKRHVQRKGGHYGFPEVSTMFFSLVKMIITFFFFLLDRMFLKCRTPQYREYIYIYGLWYG